MLVREAVVACEGLKVADEDAADGHVVDESARTPQQDRRAQALVKLNYTQLLTT